METKYRTAFIIGLIIVGGVCGRILLTSLPNFAPVGALALLAGASLANRKIALAVPLIVMLLTDLSIGFHASMLFVYLGMAIYVGLGAWAGNQIRTTRLLPAALLGSLAFFMITNLGAYFAFYPKTWAGLVDCYTLAIPFYRYTIAGDLLFGAAFFGALAIAEAVWPRLRPAAPPVAVRDVAQA
ncbi:MAG: hypothetical protein KF752_15245 [Pirellulaceae bacterium]|nr:hypothetical protein [Pirellulaceae bacterium]